MQGTFLGNLRVNVALVVVVLLVHLLRVAELHTTHRPPETTGATPWTGGVGALDPASKIPKFDPPESTTTRRLEERPVEVNRGPWSHRSLRARSALTTHLKGLIVVQGSTVASKSKVTTDVVASFLSIREELHRNFNADGDQEYFLACPSLARLPQSHVDNATDGAAFIVAFRVKEVLGALPREKYLNHWRSPLPSGQSYVLLRRLRSDLSPTSTQGTLLPIPLVPGTDSGPEDPRIVMLDDDEILVTFNMLTSWPDQPMRRQIFFYRENPGRLFKPRIRSPYNAYQFEDMPPVEKNWSPLELDGALHFVRSLLPLQVIRCNSEGNDCEHVHREGKSPPGIGPFRGGSAFVHFKTVDGVPYFLTVAHSTVFLDRHLFPLTDLSFGAFERPHLLLLRAGNPWRIVYVSGCIQLSSLAISIEARQLMNISVGESMRGLDSLRAHAIEYPAGLVLESPDSCLVSLHLNDQRPIVVRVTGFESSLTEAIKLDLESPLDGFSTPVHDIGRLLLTVFPFFVCV